MSANEFKLNEDEKPFDPPDAEKPKAARPRDAATLILRCAAGARWKAWS